MTCHQTVSAKSHLRNDNPLVIAISTNDGLSGSAENIGRLLNRKNYYFVPIRQDNPITKPRSLVFDPTYIKKSLEYALERRANTTYIIMNINRCELPHIYLYFTYYILEVHL